LFVRAGAFIPMLPNSEQHPVIQSTKAYSLKQFDLHYYHDESVRQSSGQLYDDNGELAGAYEKSAYTLLNFKSNFNKNSLSLQLTEKPEAITRQSTESFRCRFIMYSKCQNY